MATFYVTIRRQVPVHIPETCEEWGLPEGSHRVAQALCKATKRALESSNGGYYIRYATYVEPVLFKYHVERPARPREVAMSTIRLAMCALEL